MCVWLHALYFILCVNFIDANLCICAEKVSLLRRSRPYKTLTVKLNKRENVPKR